MNNTISYSPPSYLPFVVAFVAGMFVATFAMLMHKIRLKETIPFFNLLLPGLPIIEDC